jgi:hypothetical protein
LVDTRGGVIKGRKTEFQVTQARVMDCAFGDFVPGAENDPEPGRTFKSYREQAYRNTRAAGAVLWPDAFRLSDQQLAKVDGDIYEMMEAAALWNAAAAWNRFMDTGQWSSDIFRKPDNAVPTPTRKVAIVKMARGADTTKLLSPTARAEYHAFESALQQRGMELKLSTPDILGLRIPDPMPTGFEPFLTALPDLSLANQEYLETAWRGFKEPLKDATSYSRLR